MKFADTLDTVETLSYYDAPLIVHLRDPSSGQDLLVTVVDDEPHAVRWLAVPVSPELLQRFRSKDLETAVPLRSVVREAPVVYRCSGDTYDYAAVTEGEPVPGREVPETELALPGSYLHPEAYAAWESLQRRPV